MVKNRWGESTNGMANVTVLICGQMVYRLNYVGISGEESIDMTTFTTTRYVLMARHKKRGRCKNIGGIVADTAIVLCRDVIGRFGGRITCVMAGCTIAGIYSQVIESNACKAAKITGVVTRRAIKACWQMIDRRSSTDPAVMT